MSFPAGLSSDTLDANAPSMIPMQDDQWSDSHTAETDDDRDEIQEVPQPDEDVTIHPPKITTDPKSHDIHTPSSPATSPATAQEHPLDEADVSSAPRIVSALFILWHQCAEPKFAKTHCRQCLLNSMTCLTSMKGSRVISICAVNKREPRQNVKRSRQTHLRISFW